MDVTVEDDDPLTVALDPAHTLPRQLVLRAAATPNAPFLVEADSGRATTYGEFWEEVRRWAGTLRELGVEPGERVGSLLPSSIDAHAVWVATSLIGAVEVPINPELRGPFLEHVLRDAGLRRCFVRPGEAGIIEGAGEVAVGIDVVSVAAGAASVGTAEPIETGDLPGPDDLSCIIYTSGTTGAAKGVVISWAQMAAIIGRIPRRLLSAQDTIYSPWPMFHVTGRSPLIAMVDVGGRVVLRERFVADQFWPDIRAFGCTSTTVGAVTGLLLARPERDDDADNPLRITLLGRIGQEGLRFLDRFATAGMAFYGSTELGFPIGNRDVSAATADVVGWIRPGYEARLVDPDGRDVEPGEVGELWVKPPDRRMILVEYLNQPERTAQAVVDGWYRTGDAMRQRPDGGFQFVDRMTDTIRRFGENISSSAMEEIVIGEADVLECAVIGVASPVTGQDVAVLVVPVPGVAIDPAELAGHLTARLPRFMRPAHVAVVESLSKTPNGKVRRVGLEAHLAGPATWRAL